MDTTHRIPEFLLVVALAALCGFSDYCLKRASELTHPFSSVPFWIGFGTYGLSAFGWVFALRLFKLSTIGAVYSLVLIVLLALIGVTAFSEKLTFQEILGLALACISITLLMRHA